MVPPLAMVALEKLGRVPKTTIGQHALNIGKSNTVFKINYFSPCWICSSVCFAFKSCYVPTRGSDKQKIPRTSVPKLEELKW